MGKIKVTDNCNGIAGLKVIEPTVFGDASLSNGLGRNETL